jgi:diacylglycerol kinase family enzyme
LLHLRIVRFPVASYLRRGQADAIVFASGDRRENQDHRQSDGEQGQLRQALAADQAELEKHLGPIDDDDIAMTRARNHATKLAQEAVDAGYRRLVSVGGDGTFSEMMNGVIADDRPIAPDLVLAQLPGGTSNELSRSFGQLSLGEASKAIAMGHTRDIDVFRADAKGYAGDQVTRYGFVLAIVGAAATISWRAQRVPLLKRLGPISYVLMTAFTSLTYSPRDYRIRIDDEAEQNLPMWSLMLCSFDGAGEGLMLAPGADPGDRKLDLILVGDMGRWESLTKIVPNLGDGSYLAHPESLAAPRDADHHRQRSHGPRRRRRRKHRTIADVGHDAAVPSQGGSPPIAARAGTFVWNVIWFCLPPAATFFRNPKSATRCWLSWPSAATRKPATRSRAISGRRRAGIQGPTIPSSEIRQDHEAGQDAEHA